MVDQKAVFNPVGYLALQDIALWSTKLERETDYQPGVHDGHIVVQSRRGGRAELIEALLEDSSTSQIFRAFVELGLRVVYRDPASESSDAKRQVLFTLEATFAVSYEIEKLPSEKELQEFGEFHCTHNVWPFWRQHVYDTLKRASLPLVQIPFFSGKALPPTKGRSRKMQRVGESKKKARNPDGQSDQ